MCRWRRWRHPLGVRPCRAQLDGCERIVRGSLGHQSFQPGARDAVASRQFRLTGDTAAVEPGLLNEPCKRGRVGAGSAVLRANASATCSICAVAASGPLPPAAAARIMIRQAATQAIIRPWRITGSGAGSLGLKRGRACPASNDKYAILGSDIGSDSARLGRYDIRLTSCPLRPVRPAGAGARLVSRW